MLNEFKQYLLGIGKSENTALNYCDKVKLYFKWCLDSFGSEPQQLYRANVLDYISYMKTIKRYSPKSVNNHLSSLRSFNEFLIFSGRQTELAIVKNDFMKIQTQYANPCTVEQKDVEAFRQRLLEGGNKRDFAIVTLYTYTGIRRSECVNLRLDQINLIAKEIYVVGKGDKQRTVYLNDKTVHAIREYLKVRNSDSPYLFVSRQSEKMAASRINQIFNQYSDIITPKMLRHYFCSHALDTGDYKIHEVANQAGHSNVQTTAAGLNLPYMKYTCSAGTEIFDFVGMIFPDSDSGSTGDAQLDAENAVLKSMGGVNYANVSKLMNLPDLDDMDYDPAGVYKALTGVEKADASTQDCMAIVLDKVTEKVRALSKRDENSKSSGQTYTYVETDFIKALKNGYVIEIQEPSTIVQPGVLVGLNSLLEQTGSITLPTGEIIERHPDAVVVVTTNVSYEGCRGMNQSVVDRMSLVRDVEMPTPEVMVQRAMSVTGATDEYQVSQMVQVVNDLAEYCRKNSITDGSYGMRSLIDWIISAEITGDVYNAALYTIISKATADELDREALISAVLEPIIPPKRKKASA